MVHAQFKHEISWFCYQNLKENTQYLDTQHAAFVDHVFVVISCFFECFFQIYNESSPVILHSFWAPLWIPVRSATLHRPLNGPPRTSLSEAATAEGVGQCQMLSVLEQMERFVWGIGLKPPPTNQHMVNIGFILMLSIWIIYGNIWYKVYLVGEKPTPLKNMSSSIGMVTKHQRSFVARPIVSVPIHLMLYMEVSSSTGQGQRTKSWV